MPFIYYTATTLNGHLATPEHSLDWLFDIPAEGVEMAGFNYTALVMGAHTYEWVLAHEDLLAQPQRWPTLYGDKPVFVFSSRDLPVPAGADVRLLRGSVAEHLPAIRQTAGDSNVWIQGGGDLAGQFLDAGALDEIALDVAPVALTAGMPLLPREVRWPQLKLLEARMNGDFARLRWRVER
ncbi:dihydrofolate reductase family protein [Deinococcus sp. SL84]|uniref:dihydrofolate reductase family protein n=1 Tax=Deinococcus sp. SL84 TaxID=2994663 RepID=UPI0022735FBA|nr:dihydrofolate reductase family protein [Deinococcus sp. SL84]MCY1701819.1 dihydrofolate reductase family protein [Deinococcus sp. SL84]